MTIPAQSANPNPPVAFRDGLYRNAAEWAANTPRWPMGQCRVNLSDRSTYDLLQVASLEINPGNGWTTIPVDSIWFINLHGVPYIWMEVSQTHKPAYFQRIAYPGRISFFAYQKPQSKRPRLGRPVRTYQDGTVEFESSFPDILASPAQYLNPSDSKNKRYRKDKPSQWLLHASEGKLLPATPENLRTLLADDPELAARYAQERNPEHQIFQYVLLYNAR